MTFYILVRPEYKVAIRRYFSEYAYCFRLLLAVSRFPRNKEQKFFYLNVSQKKLK